MNNDCKYAGGKDCMCSACQSMRKALEEADKINISEITDREEVKRVFHEMEKALKDCRGEK